MKTLIRFGLIFGILVAFATNYSAAQEYDSYKPLEYRVKTLGITVERDSSKIIDSVFIASKWKTSSSVAGMTFDPKDSSLWFILFDEDSVQHSDLLGNILPGGFVVEKPMGLEAITIDSNDDSFWMTDILGDQIVHYDKYGNRLNDGFKIKFAGNTDPLGLLYQPSEDSTQDGTLWVIDELAGDIKHFTLQGQELLDGFNVLSLGCVNGRGLSYNQKDNSLFILNNNPQEVIHLSLTGKELFGSFRINVSEPHGLIDAIAFDAKTHSFWITNYGTAEIYHISSKSKMK